MGLLALFAEFCKIGFFAVGGGLATLPFLFHLAEKYEWIRSEIVANGQAIAQSLPGAIGVNMSAYAGFYAAGVQGAVIAAFGLMFPSIIVITIIARVFESFKENLAVKSVFSGLRPVAAGLLASAGFGAIRLSLFNTEASIWYEAFRWRESLLFLAFFFVIVIRKPHPIILIALAGAIGVILKL